MSTLKKCRGCFSEINSKATVCLHCGTLQNRLKATLIYVAGITGLFTILVSIITYIYSASVEQRKNILEAKNNSDPIQVVSYSYRRGAVFLNKSKYSVYIRDITLLGNNKHNLYTEQIQILVSGKSFIKFKNPSEDFGISPRLEDREKHWSDAWHGKSDCFSIILLSDNSWLDKNLKETIKGRLTYINSYDGTVTVKNFSTKAGLLTKDKPECSSFGHPNTIFK